MTILTGGDDTVGGGSDTPGGGADTLTAADTLQGADTLQAADDTLKAGDDTVDGADKDKKPEGAPERYEAFKMPDGIELDAAALAEFEPVARELNLTQEQAQKLVDLEAKRRVDAAAAQAKAWGDQVQAWGAAAENDPEIGGTKFTENLALAKTALDKFGSPELKAALDATGAGNHPEFIRAFVKIGKAMAEDVIVGGPKGGAKGTPGSTMFTKSNMNP